MTLYMTASNAFSQALVGGLDRVGWTAEAASEALKRAQGRSDVSEEQDVKHPPRVPVAALEEMFELAVEATGDPAIALRAGHRFRVASHGQTGAIYAYANDLPDVIALNGRYQRLAIDLGEIREDRPDAPAAPRMIFHPHALCTETGLAEYPHCVTMLMGAYVTAYRWLNWGAGEELVEVGIPAPACDRLKATADKLLRCPVSFGGSQGYLAFTERAMATPLTTANPERRALSLAKLDALLGAETGMQSFKEAVHAAIRGALGHSTVSLGTVAKRLDMSESRLRRTLRSYGWTFRGETDAVRQALMAERHAAGDSLAMIALTLGYNDQAAFNRAVKRWYGVSPGQWHPGMTPTVKD